MLLSASMLCSLSSYSQECFNENSTVAKLACADAQMTFDLNKTASEVKYAPKLTFAYINDDGKNLVIPSWFMMEKSGKLFNIHQYGFKKGDTEMVVVYKILEKNSQAEVAIMVANSPFYHGVLSLSKNQGVFTTSEVEGTFNGYPLKFMLILNNQSQLQAFALGGNVYSLHI